MFGKLMKHEFAATVRVNLPLLLGMLALALLSALSVRLAPANGGDVPGVMLFMLYGLSIVAVFAGVVIAAALRFRSSMLGDEGYLTMTLPVNLHGLLLSKLLTALVWYLLAGAAFLLSIYTVMSGEMDWFYLSDSVQAAFRESPNEAAMGVVMIFAQAVRVTLQLYAAMALGHCFNRHKLLLSVVAFFLLGTVLQTLNLRLLFFVVESRPADHFLSYSVAASAVSSALLYAITWFALRTHLNLE